MIDIIIADSQVLTSEGMISVISGIMDMRVVGLARSATDLWKMMSGSTPGLVIIDPDHDRRFSLQDIKNIRTTAPAVPLLVLSNRQDKKRVTEVIDAGIRNYVLKECGREELVRAIYNTVKGEQFYCKNTYEILFGNKLLPEKDDTLASLSPRELELIHLIAEGLTNKEIAEQLFLSIHTVKTHRKNIIKKLGFTFKNIADVASLIKKV